MKINITASFTIAGIKISVLTNDGMGNRQLAIDPNQTIADAAKGLGLTPGKHTMTDMFNAMAEAPLAPDDMPV
jgi:hypothetical protein